MVPPGLAAVGDSRHSFRLARLPSFAKASEGEPAGHIKRGRIARWGGVEASPKTGAREVDCSYEDYHRRLFAKALPEPDFR